MPITIVLFAKLFLQWFCLNMLFGRLSLVFWSEVAGIVQRECADIAFIQIKANKWLAVAFKRTVSCNYKSAKWDLALTTVKFNYLKRLQFQMNQFLSPVNYKLHQQLNILPVPGARTAFFPAWSTLSAEQIFSRPSWQVHRTCSLQEFWTTIDRYWLHSLLLPAVN